VVVLLALVAGTIFAGRFALPNGVDPFARTLGWREVAAATRQQLAEARAAGRPFAAVLTDDRAVTAELLYYMRDEPTPVRAWRDGPTPHDHYELTRAYDGTPAGPVLLVAIGHVREALTAKFVRSHTLNRRKLPAGSNKHRTVVFTALEGLKKK
jgi:hypothetical protein